MLKQNSNMNRILFIKALKIQKLTIFQYLLLGIRGLVKWFNLGCFY